MILDAKVQMMNLANETYTIFIDTKHSTEKYYKDERGWAKVSTRGREFRMTAEQVLNHLLPVLAGLKDDLVVRVKHKDTDE